MRLPRWFRRHRRRHRGVSSYLSPPASNPVSNPITTPPTPLAGVIELSSDQYTSEDPAQILTFAVERNLGDAGPVSVNYSLVAGTATPGVDYTNISGTLSWADGDQSSRQINVPILAHLAAGNFTFTIVLSNLVNTGGATLGIASATATIIRHGFGEADFPGAAWGVTRPHVLPNATLTFQVQRNFAFSGGVTVNYHTVDGTAVAGTDYTAASGTLTWAAGDGNPKSFTVTILVQAAGADKNFTVVIDTPTGGIVIGPTNVATVTITDGVPPANPVVSASYPNQLITDAYESLDDTPVLDESSETNDNIKVMDYAGLNNKVSTTVPGVNLHGIAAVVNGGTAALAAGDAGDSVNSQGSATFLMFQFVKTPVSTKLNAVCWQNGNAGGGYAIVVGDGGVILRTTDGGLTWSQRTSGTVQNLYSCWSGGNTTVWAVGAAGTILVSVDSGLTWAAQTSGVGVDLRGVWSTIGDATNVWVVGLGGTILKTSNGGTTWPAQTSNTAKDLYSVFGRDTTHVWACGQDGQVSFFNGAWASQTSGVGAGITLRGISFATTSIGFAVGDSGKVIHTINGGTTWTTLTAPDPATLYSVCYTDNAGSQFLVCGPGLHIFQYLFSATATPQLQQAAVGGASAIGTPSATSNFGGGSDDFNTDATASPTSRLYMKGFAG